MVYFVTGETERIKKGWIAPSHLLDITSISVCYQHVMPVLSKESKIQTYMNVRYPDAMAPGCTTPENVHAEKNAETIIRKLVEYIRMSSNDTEITIVHEGYLNGQNLIAAMLNAGFVEKLKKPVTFYDLAQNIHSYVATMQDSEFGPESPFTRCYDKTEGKPYTLEQKIVMFESHEKYPDKNKSFKSFVREYEFFQQYLKDRNEAIAKKEASE